MVDRSPPTRPRTSSKMAEEQQEQPVYTGEEAPAPDAAAEEAAAPPENGHDDAPPEEPPQQQAEGGHADEPRQEDPPAAADNNGVTAAEEDARQHEHEQLQQQQDFQAAAAQAAALAAKFSTEGSKRRFDDVEGSHEHQQPEPKRFQQVRRSPALRCEQLTGPQVERGHDHAEQRHPCHAPARRQATPRSRLQLSGRDLEKLFRPPALPQASDVVITPTGEAVFVMHLTSDKVGRIIGRGGATIRELEQRTGARIQVRHHTPLPCEPLNQRCRCTH